MTNKKYKGMICIFAAAFCWGIVPLMSRLLYAAGADPLDVGAVRAYLAGIIYLIYALARGLFRGVRGRDLPFLAIQGLITVCGLYVCYMTSIDLLTSAMAAVLMYTAPAFVIIFSRIFYKEPITKEKLLALLFAFAGSALVARVYDTKSLALNAVGILLGLGAGLAYSMISIMGRHTMKRYSSTQAALLPTLFGAVFFMFIRPVWQIPVGGVDMILLYIGISVLCTIAPLMLYYKGMSMGIEGGTASLMAMLDPVVESLVGVIFFADLLEPLQLAGMALMLVGAALPVMKRKNIEIAGAH